QSTTPPAATASPRPRAHAPTGHAHPPRWQHPSLAGDPRPLAHPPRRYGRCYRNGARRRIPRPRGRPRVSSASPHTHPPPWRPPRRLHRSPWDLSPRVTDPTHPRGALQGAPAPTQVGRVLRDLGIRWIPASSPQGKGRIERLFGTFQDRLLAELRLSNVRTREDANAFLGRFLRRYNARFTHRPTDATPAYRPWPPTLDPATVFCFKYLRIVANDNTVPLGPHRLQILPGPNGRSYARAQVEVHQRLDGSFAIAHHGRFLPAAPLPSADPLAPLRAQHLPRPGSEPLTRHTTASRTRFPPPRRDRDILRKTPAASPQRQSVPGKPRPDHPWNRYAQENRRRKELKQAGVTFSLNP